MSEQQTLDGDQGDTAQETVPAADVIETASPEAAAAVLATEAEARKAGWADSAHWRGRPEDFIGAEEYLHMYNRHLPIVNARLKETTDRFEKAQAEWAKQAAQHAQRVADLERKQQEAERNRAEQEAEMDRQFRAQSAAHAKMMDLQRQELLGRTEREKREALMIDDPAQRAAAYDAASQRERAAVQTLIEAEKPVELPRPAAVQERQQASSSQVSPEAKSWLDRNTWLRDNPTLMKIAGQIEVPQVPMFDFRTNPEEHLEYIKSQMKSFGISIPEEGTEPAMSAPAPAQQPNIAAASTPPAAAQSPAPAQRGSPVEGASRRGATPAPKEKGYKDLPPAAKAGCEMLIGRKFFKGDADAYRKQYAATYYAEYGDE